jgi:hypothetical protein
MGIIHGSSERVGPLAVVGTDAAHTACTGNEALVDRTGVRVGSPLTFINAFRPSLFTDLVLKGRIRPPQKAVHPDGIGAKFRISV